MFKNARNYAIDKRLLNEKSCPSYFLECMLYNVPNSAYHGNESEIFYNVLNSLLNNIVPCQSMLKQNGIQCLFDNATSSWNKNDANKSVDAIVSVWNNWGKF